MGRKPGKYRQTARVFGMLDTLRSHSQGVSIQALADAFGVSTRHVARDLAALEAAGHDIERLRGSGGPIVRLRALPPAELRLSDRERSVLFAARSAFDPLAGTPLLAELDGIYERLLGGAPHDQRSELSSLRQRFVVLPYSAPTPQRAPEGVLADLIDAVFERHRVRYVYRGADRRREAGVLEPYALTTHLEKLYVLGRSATKRSAVRDGPLRIYTAEQFSQLKPLLKQRFEVPADFSVERHFHGIFGVAISGPPEPVVVEVASSKRQEAESHVWHPSQRLERLSDGRVRLRFELPDASRVVPMVLSWGEHARVIEPPSLAAHLDGIVERMARARHTGS